jgi:hypothetical protein
VTAITTEDDVLKRKLTNDTEHFEISRSGEFLLESGPVLAQTSDKIVQGFPLQADLVSKSGKAIIPTTQSAYLTDNIWEA